RSANQAADDVSLIACAPRERRKLQRRRSAVFAKRRTEQPAALAELEQRRLKPSDVVARKLAAGKGRLGVLVGSIERRFARRRAPFRGRSARRRRAAIFERWFDAVR